jgi:hypothetical protein
VLGLNNGRVLLWDTFSDALVQLIPATGARVLLSRPAGGVGTGPQLTTSAGSSSGYLFMAQLPGGAFTPVSLSSFQVE